MSGNILSVVSARLHDGVLSDVRADFAFVVVPVVYLAIVLLALAFDAALLAVPAGVAAIALVALFDHLADDAVAGPAR